MYTVDVLIIVDCGMLVYVSVTIVCLFSSAVLLLHCCWLSTVICIVKHIVFILDAIRVHLHLCLDHPLIFGLWLLCGLHVLRWIVVQIYDLFITRIVKVVIIIINPSSWHGLFEGWPIGHRVRWSRDLVWATDRLLASTVLGKLLCGWRVTIIIAHFVFKY